MDASDLQKPFPPEVKSDFYVNDKYNDEKYQRPGDDVNPSLKKDQYAVAYCQYLYSKFLRGGYTYNYQTFQYMQLLEMYAEGRQPISAYQDWLIGDLTENPRREMWASIHWDIMSPAPKFMQWFRGRLKSQEYRTVATAIDEYSGAEREQMLMDAMYELEMGAIEKDIRAKMGAPKQDAGTQFVPESREELEGYKQLGGFKLKVESDIEKAIEYTEYISNWEEIENRLIDDLAKFKKCCYRDYVDEEGREMFEWMDPKRLVCDWSLDRGFQDISEWAYLKYYNIATIRKITGWDEDKVRSLAQRMAGVLGNSNWIWNDNMLFYDPLNDNYVYDSFKVPVLLAEWQTVDTEYRMKKPDGTYKAVNINDGYKTKNKKRQAEQVKKTFVNWRTANWIIGTEYVFSDGVVPVTPRPSPKNPRPSLHAAWIPGKSFIEQIVPNLNGIEENYLKMQVALKAAKPQGYNIEVSALEGINLGGEGSNDMTPLELIALATQTGHILWRAGVQNGQYYQNVPPIKENEGGIGAYLQEFIVIFDMHFRFISEMSGIDTISATNPNVPDTATQSKIALKSTADAIQPYYNAYLQVKQSGGVNASSRIQLLIKHCNGYEIYYPVMGTGAIESLKIAKDNIDRTYGIKIEPIPQEETRQMLLQEASEAMQPGKDGESITYADYIMIVPLILNYQLKQARMVLLSRLEKRKKEIQQNQQANIQLQSQEAQAQQKLKMQGELTLIAAEEAEKRKSIMLQGEEDRKTEAVKYLFAKQESADEHTRELQLRAVDSILAQLEPQVQPAAQ